MQLQFFSGINSAQVFCGRVLTWNFKGVCGARFTRVEIRQLSVRCDYTGRNIVGPSVGKFAGYMMCVTSVALETTTTHITAGHPCTVARKCPTLLQGDLLTWRKSSWCILCPLTEITRC